MSSDNFLQLANGGITKRDGAESLNGTLSWQQPGFVSMNKLVFSIDNAITSHILLRDSSGGSIETMDFDVTAFDETTADVLNATLTKLSSGDDFYTASHDTIRIDIDLVGYGQIIRVVNLTVENLDTNEIIQARVNVTGASEPFGYISFYGLDRRNRKKVSSYGNEMVLESDVGGSSILLSPGAAFQEVNPPKDTYHFSYPSGQLFYYLEQDENLEEFDFSISSTSHPELTDVIKTYSLGSNRRVGIVEIDGYLPVAVSPLSGIMYVDIKAVGNDSSSQHTFRIYFNKGFKKNQLQQP